MYKVTYDRKKNRVYGILEGFMKLDEVKVYTIELIKALDQTKPGFTAIFDNSKLKVLPQECMEEMKKGKDYAIKKGLTKSAIIMDSAMLKLQVKRNLGKMDKDNKEEYFDSMDAAEAFLDR